MNESEKDTQIAELKAVLREARDWLVSDWNNRWRILPRSIEATELFVRICHALASDAPRPEPLDSREGRASENRTADAIPNVGAG